MSQNAIYVGIDVDDVRHHGSALDHSTGKVLDFHCRATLRGLVQQLEKVYEYFGDVGLSLCYEASYVGFSLQRDLADRGYSCDVVAPLSIPRRGGKSKKTDRIDATELAEFHAKGLLTIVAAQPMKKTKGKGRLIGQKRALKPNDVWSIRVRLPVPRAS